MYLNNVAPGRVIHLIVIIPHFYISFPAVSVVCTSLGNSQA
jgi:hypothetical protein